MILMTPENKDDGQESRAKLKICGRATDSLILGILTIFPFAGVLFGIGAIITGNIALSRIKRSQGQLWGRGFAIAGIIVGVLGVAFNLYWIGAAGKDRYHLIHSKIKVDLHSIAKALESYYLENNAYPAWAKGEAGANSFAGPKAGVYLIPTFRIWQNENEVGKFATLTTPVAYITGYPSDPWADTRGATFGYYSNEKGWILFSWGPDTDENDEDSWDLATDVEKVYKSSVSQPSLTLITGTSSSSAHEAYTYDPSNGIISPGDIWRVKQ